MAIKEYRVGDYESVDFEINDAGTDPFTIRLNGDLLNYLFSDMALYSDSGRTIALSPADWEVYTNDATYTALEAGDDGSGKTISTEIKILNATYQTGTIYARCNSFGTYASGLAQGVTYITLTDSSFTSNNYNYTIDSGEKEAFIDCSAVTVSSQTITMIQGTHPCGNAGPANRVKVIGSNTVNIPVTWSGAGTDWYGEKLKTVEYFFSGSDLSRGPGEELLRFDNSETSEEGTFLLSNGLHRIGLSTGSATLRTAYILIDDTKTRNSTVWADSANFNYQTVDGNYTSNVSGWGLQRVWKVYE